MSISLFNGTKQETQNQSSKTYDRTDRRTVTSVRLAPVRSDGAGLDSSPFWFV
jgi:hypothetical protein